MSCKVKPSLIGLPKHSRILVRMPNWLGDFVMATPILTDLRHHWPEAKIIAWCQGPLGTLIEKDPHVDEILIFQKPKKWWRIDQFRAVCEPIAQGSFDLAILLTNSLSSAFWAWKGGVPQRLGYACFPRTLFLTTAVAFPTNRQTQHLVITYKQLIEPMGIKPSSTAPKLYLTQEEREGARKQLRLLGIDSSHSILGINPGAAFGSAKCWPPSRFKELSARLLRSHPHLKILFFGDKNGEPLVSDICQSLDPKRRINLAGKTSLRELMAYIEACDLLLTNDSGPMHMASALKVPLIALFGSTSDVATGPYLGGLVIHKHVPCSPCYRRECPIDFRCMRQIEVDEVQRAVDGRLSLLKN